MRIVAIIFSKIALFLLFWRRFELGWFWLKTRCIQKAGNRVQLNSSVGEPLKDAVVGYAAVTQAGLWPSLPSLCRYATHHVFKRQRALLFCNG
jgi:hypothetical protein